MVFTGSRKDYPFLPLLLVCQDTEHPENSVFAQRMLYGMFKQHEKEIEVGQVLPILIDSFLDIIFTPAKETFAIKEVQQLRLKIPSPEEMKSKEFRNNFSDFFEKGKTENFEFSGEDK